MELKLFGKSLFEVKKSKSDFYGVLANNQTKESKFLPDFYINGQNFESSLANYVVVETTPGSAVAVPIQDKKAEEVNIHLTPKGVFELKLLHDETFKLNTNPEYVDQQITDFKDKLALIKAEEFDMTRGVQEISSVLIRLENRKKYETEKDFFEEYPYTTSSKINEVVEANNYLKIGQVAQFVADMPKEAVAIMKEYNKATDRICGKQAVFYIIADKKDFEKTTKRRDPILLAQSPFGHFWQILGAWDKEMLLLENL
jgi:hypothetical protein